MNEPDDNGMRAILNRAFPETTYVTQAQFTMLEESLDKKLKTSKEAMMLHLLTSEAKQKNWILTGCLAIVLSSTAGYVSIVIKIDRLSMSLPKIEGTLDTRRGWMEQKDRQDDRQDQALAKAAPGYVPLPYNELPK